MIQHDWYCNYLMSDICHTVYPRNKQHFIRLSGQGVLLFHAKFITQLKWSSPQRHRVSGHPRTQRSYNDDPSKRSTKRRNCSKPKWMLKTSKNHQRPSFSTDTFQRLKLTDCVAAAWDKCQPHPFRLWLRPKHRNSPWILAVMSRVPNLFYTFLHVQFYFEFPSLVPYNC